MMNPPLRGCPPPPPPHGHELYLCPRNLVDANFADSDSDSSSPAGLRLALVIDADAGAGCGLVISVTFGEPTGT
jgi:hypothetical protein